MGSDIHEETWNISCPMDDAMDKNRFAPDLVEDEIVLHDQNTVAEAGQLLVIGNLAKVRMRTEAV